MAQYKQENAGTGPWELGEAWKSWGVSAAAPLAVACSGGRTHPVIGLWPVALADDLEAALRAGDRKIDRWTARHGVTEVSFAHAAVDPFFNINTPDDLAAAERLLALYPGLSDR